MAQSLTAKLSADNTQIVVPIEGFTLSALYPQDSLLMSPSYAGTFNVGESVAVQNVARRVARAASCIAKRVP